MEIVVGEEKTMGNGCSAEKNLTPPPPPPPVAPSTATNMTTTTTTTTRTRRPPCVYFLNGYCRNGDSCPFFHDKSVVASGNATRRTTNNGALSEAEAIAIALAESEAATKETVAEESAKLLSSKEQEIFERKHLQRQHSWYGLEVSVQGRVKFVRHSISGKKTEKVKIDLDGDGEEDAWIVTQSASGNALNWTPAREGYAMHNVPGLKFEELMRVSKENFFPKLAWFRKTMAARQIPFDEGHLDLAIDRSELLEDSVKQIMALKGDKLRQQWRVRFNGEKGLDAGGVTREWIELIMKTIFDPMNGLFKFSEDVSN